MTTKCVESPSPVMSTAVFFSDDGILLFHLGEDSVPIANTFFATAEQAQEFCRQILSAIPKVKNWSAVSRSGHNPIPANESELYNEALRNVALAGLSSMSEGMVKSKSMAKRIAVLRKGVDAACGATK